MVRPDDRDVNSTGQQVSSDPDLNKQAVPPEPDDLTAKLGKGLGAKVFRGQSGSAGGSPPPPPPKAPGGTGDAPEPDVWLWQDVIAPGDIVTISGKPRNEYIYFACDLVARWSHGHEMIDGNPGCGRPIQTKILVRETNRKVFVETLASMSADMNNVEIVGKLESRTFRLNHREHLDSFCDPDDTDVLIIYSPGDFIDGYLRNDDRDARLLINWLKQYQEDYHENNKKHITIIVIDKMRKNGDGKDPIDDVCGSVELADKSSCILMIRLADGGGFQLGFEKTPVPGKWPLIFKPQLDENKKVKALELCTDEVDGTGETADGAEILGGKMADAKRFFEMVFRQNPYWPTDALEDRANNVNLDINALKKFRDTTRTGQAMIICKPIPDHLYKMVAWTLNPDYPLDRPSNPVPGFEADGFDQRT